ncbi:UNVERIFIED_CONTAM: hypothetical protein HDU68_001714 [Siphonaria sp. JEL0065]|nr:hypothetical protein HDU68_001714 [Siphonaria sp. JEL0065]
MTPKSKRSRSESMDPNDQSDSGSDAEQQPLQDSAGGPVVDGRSTTPVKSKRGRKKGPGNSLERRTAQNRLAQRNFRERRMNYVKELEEKLEEYKTLLASGNAHGLVEENKTLRTRITELEQEYELLRKMNVPLELNAGVMSTKIDSGLPVPPKCTQCAIEQIKTAECMKLNKELELKVNQLELDCTTLRVSVGSLALAIPDHSRPASLSPPMGIFPPPLPPMSTFSLLPQGSGNTGDVVSPRQQRFFSRMFNFGNVPRKTPPFSDSSPSPKQSPNHVSSVAASVAVSVAGSDEWVDVDIGDRVVPSIDLYGPLKVEAYRYALKQIPTLANCKYVDELVDLVVTLTKCTSRKALRRDMVRSIALKHQILDVVHNLLERSQVIEIIEEFKVKLGLQHFNHFYQNMSNSKSLAEVQRKVLNRLKHFKQLAISIPSLSNSEDLIDQLCLEFANQSLYTDTAEKEEKYIDFLGVSGRLQLLCQTEEDRKKLMLAMEVARESNREFANVHAPFVNKDPVATSQ